MGKVFEYYFEIYLTEFIIGCLILAIVVVIFSILHVIFQSDEPKITKGQKLAKGQEQLKQKVKYSKEFLKRVKDIDLNLTDSSKK